MKEPTPNKVGKCTTCGVNFVGTAAQPPAAGECVRCANQRLECELATAKEQLAIAQQIQHAEKDILIKEIEEHTKTKEQLAAAAKERDNLRERCAGLDLLRMRHGIGLAGDPIKLDEVQAAREIGIAWQEEQCEKARLILRQYASTHQDVNAEWAKRIVAAMQKERDDARRACAEKDEALREYMTRCPNNCDSTGAHPDSKGEPVQCQWCYTAMQALSTTCGTGYLSPGEVDKKVQEAVVRTHRYFAGEFRSIGYDVRAIKIMNEADRLESSKPTSGKGE